MRSTLLAATVALSAAACGRATADAAANAGPAPVTVGPDAISVIAVQTINSGPAISGSLTAEKTASIRSEVSGAVIAVLAEPGARVTTGTTLARVDDAVPREAMLSATSAVTQAQLAADIAHRETGRSEKLLAAGAIAENALESTRRADLAASAALDDAKARLASAQKNLDNTVIKAPYDGIVSERQVNAGDIVSPGSPLFTLVDPSTMRLEGAVPAEKLGLVHVGAPVRFEVTGYPGRPFIGTITNIYPSADPATRQVRLYVRIPNAGNGLVAGLFATGRVSSSTRQGLTVPAGAVDQRGVKPVVTRLKNGKAEVVEVALGMRDEGSEMVEVTKGLAAGDTLLVGAAEGITPGAPVKVSTVSPSADQPKRN
ncbi:MAG TPA: efflux RND transporter periplasmic adaptor subunit [Gemmatimonadaceae bacterium]|nr:efflux RND transporter periplasmic adaptor subunit [Gemmatimonadaceae bacterium]